MSQTEGWMPLFITRYLNDTEHLNTAQHGAYLLLIMHYWRHGPLADDDASLAAIARMDCRTWRKQFAGVIRKFFRCEDGLLFQKRAEIERARAADISDKRRAAAFASHRSPPTGGGSRTSKNTTPSEASAGAFADVQREANAGASASASVVSQDANAPPDAAILQPLHCTLHTRKNSSLLEDKEEAAGAREREDSKPVHPVAAELAAILKIPPLPYTPSVVYQLAALQPARPVAPMVARPQEPERTVEEQLAILRQMMEEEKVSELATTGARAA